MNFPEIWGSKGGAAICGGMGRLASPDLMIDVKVMAEVLVKPTKGIWLQTRWKRLRSELDKAG